jgi:hypothetical protein
LICKKYFDYGFSTFLEYVPYLAEAKLPAMAAHIKMVPFERTESLKTHLTNIKPKNGCCYDVILSKEWDDTFGFNCTEFYEGVHSGQIAFPGGKWETEDENFSVTALRNP